MARSRRLFVSLTGLVLSISLVLGSGMTVQAGSNRNYLNSLNGGVAAITSTDTTSAAELINATEKELNLTPVEEERESTLVMANVQSALNVRAEASEDSEKVGKIYKDCGGRILERKDGWTKLQSGNIIGWAKDDYLLFGDEAAALANDVGKMVGTVSADAVNVRTSPSTTADIYCVMARGEMVEVVDVTEDGWICIDYEGQDGYVLEELMELDFQIDYGETIEEINARQAAEAEAKRYVNYGEFTTDADTTMLLAALIQCEAGGESYEGQLAVGAVVMNRVRSAAYPDSIHGVIYASGQFTPALNGKVNALYESGKINASCIQAAEEALSGASNVGDCTHFRRNNGRDGIVIGNHVFY